MHVTRPENHFYGYLLNACEKLFEGELEQNTFEENMRFLFGTKVSSNHIRFVSFPLHGSFAHVYAG